MFSTLVIDAHPDAESLSAAIARSYAAGHGNARLLPLRDLSFDPHMRFGYRKRMEIEPDLQDAREALHLAKRIVVVSPMWWGSVPALLKGFFDRALLPRQEYVYSDRGLPRGLLRGRSGRLFLLADTPAIALPVIGTHAAAQVGRHTLKFCGVRPFRTHRLLGVKHRSPEQLERWIAQAARIGARDRRGDDARPAPPAPQTTPARRAAVTAVSATGAS
ncbi:NAD(P)H-dependent oxidoreductase [Leucobacter triazinivorans]|uniref:Flavodoxin family protein n=1 Tax=Leucobacter triazinivorans TaxID=1784719 RepID=A0A4P6KEH1_9MICO|nr:NAD(P)H-dependent oxidoreductase [Leucobacter triazinivorans]QBE48328.1 flavodoxin family protein [Leucobacter triazinivorans]